MGLFGHGGGLSKAWKKTKQVASDVWKHGGKEALTVGGIVAGAILTGGALGIVGAGTGALVSTGTAVGAGVAVTGATAYKGAQAESAAQDQREAQAQYQAEVNTANAKADAQNRANLLRLKKQLVPTTKTNSSVGGGSSVNTDLNLIGGTKLG